jgi:membrane fusion protein (multidrug efflux system)
MKLLKSLKYNIKNMKLSKLIVIIGVLTAAFLFSSCGKNSGNTNNNKKLPLVKVMDIKPTSFSENFKVVGVVKPYASAKISSEEGGLILSIPKDKGSFVNKGEVVVRLKKDVESASLEQAEAQFELARINYEKQKELWEQNATTELQYLTAKWQMEAAEKGLNVLKTRIATGYVRAPISGVIDDRYMNKGEMSGPGSPILNIVDVSKVKISAGIPEKYVTRIKKGQSVTITVDVLPGEEFEGKINYIAPTLASVSRTFEIEVIISNKDRHLKPEMNANVQIAQFSTDDAIVIPQDYIIDFGDEQYVYVLDIDIARKRILKLGNRNGNDVLIEDGLRAGDKLINVGFQSLADGDKVQVVQ